MTRSLSEFKFFSTPDESRGWRGLLVPHVLDSEVLDHDLGVELDPLQSSWLLVVCPFVSSSLVMIAVASGPWDLALNSGWYLG
jgi:hypothetical protein